MAPKKSTEQTATVVAPAPSVEKTKKSKKTEQTVTPSVPSVSEKPKKSKKTEQTTTVLDSTPVESSVSEKPKKVSKKKVSSEALVESVLPVSSEVSESGDSPVESETPLEPKKRVSRKKAKVQESETSTETSTETPETPETPEKRVRKVVNQETLKADVEQLKEQVETEIQRLRTEQQKNKGVKFLKLVNKSLKTLSSDLNRVLKSKTKTTRNKNTSSGFMKPVKISSEMSLFTKWDPSMLYSRVDVTKFLCSYIKNNSLQNPDDRRQILCDEKLASLLKVDVESEQPLTYPGLQQHIQQHFITDSSSVSEEVVQP